MIDKILDIILNETLYGEPKGTFRGKKLDEMTEYEKTHALAYMIRQAYEHSRSWHADSTLGKF